MIPNSARLVPNKVLVLTIEVPGIWADDLDESAAEWADSRLESEEERADARLEVVTEEWISREAVLTVLSHSGGDDPQRLNTYEVRIVGAEARDA